ncbi:hypothetical protein [Desulfovibrio aminophilus]|uniref:hypothetical protein n=1 Tax=Desulfovibrio aminophilus TaxID=81425 RepID=UPI0033981D1F
MALQEKLHAPVIGLFLFRGEITSGQLTSLPMVVKAFAAQPVPIAGIGAIAVCGVDLGPWTLIRLAHGTTPRGRRMTAFLTVAVSALYEERSHLSILEDHWGKSTHPSRERKGPEERPGPALSFRLAQDTKK